MVLKATSAVALACAALFSVNCRTGIERGPTGVGSVPEQSQYRPLGNWEPTPTDPDTGKVVTSMSVALVHVAPWRGSTVRDVDCIDDLVDGFEKLFADPSSAECLNYRLRYYFAGVDNPNTGMDIKVWASTDDVLDSGDQMWTNTGMGPGTKEFDKGPIQFRDPLPRYLIVQLAHNAGGTGNSQYKDPAERAIFKIFLDFRR